MSWHDIQQYSPEWWELRRGLPTASQFHRIMTPTKRNYASGVTGANTYINELLADLYDPWYGQREDYQTAAMRQGHVMEPEARRWYEAAVETRVRHGGFFVTDDGRFGASPDGLVGDNGVLEVKSPQLKGQIAVLRGGVIPPQHLVQCHGHLICSGRTWCDYLSYCRGLPHLYVRVTADDYTDALRKCLDRFADELAAARERIESIPFDLPEREEPVVF